MLASQRFVLKSVNKMRKTRLYVIIFNDLTRCNCARRTRVEWKSLSHSTDKVVFCFLLLRLLFFLQHNSKHANARARTECERTMTRAFSPFPFLPVSYKARRRACSEYFFPSRSFSVVFASYSSSSSSSSPPSILLRLATTISNHTERRDLLSGFLNLHFSQSSFKPLNSRGKI